MRGTCASLEAFQPPLNKQFELRHAGWFDRFLSSKYLRLVLSAAVARHSFESLPTLSHNQWYQAQRGQRIGPGDSPEGIRN